MPNTATARPGPAGAPPHRLLLVAREPAYRQQPGRPAEQPPLARRERDVLALMADGLSTREVALRLCYSERTIKNVLQDLMLRFQFRNRTQAVAWAVRHGLI
jgi:DNA-binding NarL/FixJ family response regulator